ncbi:MAG: rhodanese-like domain-containing protein [Planctomycetota bacterium]|jgi:rhodanese-related sulfurtransferase
MLFRKRAATDEERLARIDEMYERVRTSFPGVPEIPAAEVMDRRAAGEELVLVDTRTPEERAASMIPGAVTAEQVHADPSAYAETTLVCYCTIGGRSGRLAEALRERGMNACNMRGAILAWTHAGGELASDEGPTRRVHTHGPKYDLVAEGYEAIW